MEGRILYPCTDFEGSRTIGYMILCPGCGHGHLFNTEPGPNGAGGQKPCWTFDGNMERPTFSPSMLSRTTRFTAKGQADYDAWAEAGRPKREGPFDSEPLVCHSFVRDGKIEFLPDCTHEMAGRTVPLEPW